MFTQRIVQVWPIARSSWDSVKKLEHACSCLTYKSRTLSTVSLHTLPLTHTHQKASSSSLVLQSGLPQCVQMGVRAPYMQMRSGFSTSIYCSCRLHQLSSCGLVCPNRDISRVPLYSTMGSTCAFSIGRVNICRTPVTAGGQSLFTGRSYCTFSDDITIEDEKDKMEEEGQDEAVQKTMSNAGNINRQGNSEGNGKDEWSIKIQEARDYVDTRREKGEAVPSSVNDEQLEYMAQLSKKKRNAYINHLFKKELKKIGKKLKKQEQFDSIESETKPHTTWNTLQRKVTKKDINELAGWRLSAAMKFNPQLVFDCIYEEFMTWQDVRSLAAQFGALYSTNSLAHEPFYIRMVNFNHGGLIAKEMKRLYGNQYENLLVDLNGKGLLDIYSSQDLVYMSPDSDKIMTQYDPNKVYVIGALVDKGHQDVGASLSQAKQLGIEHCRLPLDAYFHWSSGAHKNMTLDSMATIFVELNTHNNMGRALQKSVPERKTAGLKLDVNDKHKQEMLLRTIGDDRLMFAQLEKHALLKKAHKERSKKNNLHAAGGSISYAISQQSRLRSGQTTRSKFDSDRQSGGRGNKNSERSWSQRRRPLQFEEDDDDDGSASFRHNRRSFSWHDEDSSNGISRKSRERRDHGWNDPEGDDRGFKFSRAKLSKKLKLDE